RPGLVLWPVAAAPTRRRYGTTRARPRIARRYMLAGCPCARAPACLDLLLSRIDPPTSATPTSRRQLPRSDPVTQRGAPDGAPAPLPPASRVLGPYGCTAAV